MTYPLNNNRNKLRLNASRAGGIIQIQTVFRPARIKKSKYVSDVMESGGSAESSSVGVGVCGGTKLLLNPAFVVKAGVSHSHEVVLSFLVGAVVNNSVDSL